ncbi:MAG: PCRF domain-containing protein, partial [Nocardioidaceae bacterium]
MADVDPRETLKALDATLVSIEAVVDVPALRSELIDLGEQAAVPDLWDDQERAQKVNSRLSFVQGEIDRVGALRRRVDDLSVLYDLAESEDDEDTRVEADTELSSVRRAIDELEVRTLLSGEYDARDALVTIQSQAGGV